MSESIKYNFVEKLKELELASLLADIHVASGKLYCSLRLPPEIVRNMDELQTKVEEIAIAIPGLKQVNVSFTMEKPAALAKEVVKNEPVAKIPVQESSGPAVPNIIAIASGKGGVGKSTSAINIARALLKKGLSVGLLDLDIYGPSIPKLAKIEGKKPESAIDSQGIKKILPIISDGLQVMSIGFFITAEAPVVWRGHMATSFVKQMLNGVAWDNLDVLIIDLPPGTGDIQLTLVQKANVTGAIIISTPEELALLDVRRAIGMLRKTKVPILGMIENMSYFIAPDTGKTYYIFGKNGAKEEAKKQDINLLAQVPFDLALNSSAEYIKTFCLDDLYNDIANQIIPMISAPDKRSR